jgi:hypothetical protein
LALLFVFELGVLSGLLLLWLLLLKLVSVTEGEADKFEEGEERPDWESTEGVRESEDWRERVGSMMEP